MKKTTDLLEVHALTPSSTRGILKCGPITVSCALGRGGRRVTKREGDGATPKGCFELLNVYYRPDRENRPRTELPVEPLTPQDGWCDDPAHPRYNRPIELPFDAGHEKMWRADRLYDLVVVLNQNMFPAVPGRGSAIFFHVAREGYAPTEGCIAIAPEHMRLVLTHVTRGCMMRIY